MPTHTIHDTPLLTTTGFHDLHPDTNHNFQMNRWINWSGDPQMLADYRSGAERVSDNASWIALNLELAERAKAQGRGLSAAWHLRAAEFVMHGDDPRRLPARQAFCQAIRDREGLGDRDFDAVPYRARGTEWRLPSLRLNPEAPRGALLLFGGFDSTIEELIGLARHFAAAGWDTIAFEGPGQGAVLEAGLAMDAAWEGAVSAVLDHYRLDRACLLGLSLGGYLALRAAAFEPRVDRVIAWDVLCDFRAVMFAQMPKPASRLLKLVLRLPGSRPLVNGLLSQAMRRDPEIDWGLRHGMRVMGVKDPHGFIVKLKDFATAGFAARVGQDVLLLAGNQDHFVPLPLLWTQMAQLANARSLSSRVFTAAESAGAHCQVGNVKLALDTIGDWLAGLERRG